MSGTQWFPFDKSKGARQKLSPLKKWVVVQLEPKPPEHLQLDESLPTLVATKPPGIAVGYRKDAAGDKECPYFVIPGIGGEVTAWCDCLPDDFEPNPDQA